MRTVGRSMSLALAFGLVISAGCGAEKRRSGTTGGGEGEGEGANEGEGEGAAEGEGEGAAEGEGEGGGLSNRLDGAAYVAGDEIEQTVSPGGTPVMVQVPSGRASVTVPPGAIAEPLPFSITSRPLTDFSDWGDLINGVYDFGPEGYTFDQRVRIRLPLNGLSVESGRDLELVFWLGGQWQAEEDTLVELDADRQHASAAVGHFTPYGLRFADGWPFGEGEGEGEGPAEGEGAAEGEGEGPIEGIGECNLSCMMSSDGATCCKGCGDCADIPMGSRCQPECPEGYAWDCEMVCCFSYDSFTCAGVEIGECASACTSRPGAICCTGCGDCNDLPWDRQCQPSCSGSGLEWDCEQECCLQTMEGSPYCVGPPR